MAMAGLYFSKYYNCLFQKGSSILLKVKKVTDKHDFKKKTLKGTVLIYEKQWGDKALDTTCTRRKAESGMLANDKLREELRSARNASSEVFLKPVSSLV